MVRGGEILLIRKLRGLGKGKVNGVGGKVDPGEEPIEAAIREFEEEVLAHPVDVVKLGEIGFDDSEGVSLLIHVFRAEGVCGTPDATDEAIPLWASLDAIPYEEMWADDPLWLRHVVSSQPFRAFAKFEGDVMLDCVVSSADSF